MTTVLLCDGHSLMRGGLRMILEDAAFEVVGDARSADEAAKLGIDGRGVRGLDRSVGPCSFGSGEVTDLNLVRVERLAIFIDDEAVPGTVVAGAYAALDVVAEDAAAETVGDVVGAGGVGDVGSLGEGSVEERNVHADHLADLLLRALRP